MHRISQVLDAITEDRRASHLFDTKAAAEALGIHPNKFGVWWTRTQEKLASLALIQPGELAAEFAVLFARSEMRRQQILSRSSAPPAAPPPRH